MSTHNICFYGELEKIIPEYHQILLLNNSSEFLTKLPHMQDSLFHDFKVYFMAVEVSTENTILSRTV